MAVGYDVVRISGSISIIGGINGEINLPEVVTPAAYEGPYEVTPTNELQVLPTNGFYMEENVIIEPIPNNYGLITWDGSTLTVS